MAVYSGVRFAIAAREFAKIVRDLYERHPDAVAPPFRGRSLLVAFITRPITSGVVIAAVGIGVLLLLEYAVKKL
jgi:hypothetical protein